MYETAELYLGDELLIATLTPIPIQSELIFEDPHGSVLDEVCFS
jgi:hypothetical protein